MTIITETAIRYFDFWGNACENAAKLTSSELDTVEMILEDLFPDGINATELNDLFSYDFETVMEWLNLSEEELDARD